VLHVWCVLTLAWGRHYGASSTFRWMPLWCSAFSSTCTGSDWGCPVWV